MDPLDFFLRANIYQKLPIFAIFVAVSSHFKVTAVKIWRERANLGDPPQAKFCIKNRQGYTVFEQIFTKNYQFRRF